MQLVATRLHTADVERLADVHRAAPVLRRAQLVRQLLRLGLRQVEVEGPGILVEAAGAPSSGGA